MYACGSQERYVIKVEIYKLYLSQGWLRIELDYGRIHGRVRGLCKEFKFFVLHTKITVCDFIAMDNAISSWNIDDSPTYSVARLGNAITLP